MFSEAALSQSRLNAWCRHDEDLVQFAWAFRARQRVVTIMVRFVLLPGLPVCASGLYFYKM
jgi:hypothetical protein